MAVVKIKSSLIDNGDETFSSNGVLETYYTFDQYLKGNQDVVACASGLAGDFE